MTPKELEYVIENCKARNTLAPSVPQLPANVLELAVLELVTRLEEYRRRGQP